MKEVTIKIVLILLLVLCIMLCMPQVAESGRPAPMAEPTIMPTSMLTPRPTEPMPTPEPVEPRLIAVSPEIERIRSTPALEAEELTSREMFEEIFPGEDYDATLDILAKVLYGESRGVYGYSITNCACVIWCVGNRVDVEKRGSNFRECATANAQFAYKKRYPVQQHFRDLAEDVLARWMREKNGETDVGRVLPPEYVYFAGKDGYNRFRTESGKRLTPKTSAIYEEGS
jgi:hypothetical protein